MRKSLLLLFLFVCFLSIISYSQTVQLSGKVTEKGSNTGLYGVNIMIKNKLVVDSKLLGTTTDFDGNYRIALYPGQYEVKFVYIGFEEVKKDIELIVGKPEVINIELAPKAEIIEEVVVSAGKYEQKLSEVTVSMEVMKPQTIENLNALTLDYALNVIPGVDLNDSQVSIRATTGWSYGAGSRVIILMDELPIMSADAGDVKWNFVPIENVSQVEVVKGASSALFGSSALGGVINVRSGYPTDKPVTKVSYFSGVYGKPKDLRNKWWEKEFFSTNNSALNPLNVPLRDEIFYWVRSPMYSGLSFHHAQQLDNLDLSMGGNHFINEGYRESEYERRSRFNANLRYRSQKIQGLAVGFNSNFMAVDKSDFFMWQSDTNAYKPNLLFGDAAPTQGFRMNIDPFIYYYKTNGSKYSLRTRYFRTENVIPNDTLKNSIGHTFYGEFQYQTTIKEKWNITAGIVESYSMIQANLFGDHTSNNLAGYAQVDVKFGRLKLSGGLRAESFRIDSVLTESLIETRSTINSSMNIPFKPVFRSGANYAVTDNTFVRASVGQGYRFPSIAEKFTATSLGMVQIFPNPYLEPEEGWSAEVGVKQGYRLRKWRGFADLAIYKQEIYNTMEFNFAFVDTSTYMAVPPNSGGLPGFQAQNIGNIVITGLDASASIGGKVRKVLITGMAGYNYNYPVYKNYVDSTASSLSPILKYRNKHTIKADLNIETKRISLGTTIIYKSPIENVDRLFCDERDRYSVDTVTYDSYRLFSSFLLPGYWNYRIENAQKPYFNIDVRFSFIFSEKLRASFIVKNLLNQEYVGRPGDMHPPRRFEIMISSNF